MAKLISASSHFVSGAARFKSLIYVIAKDRGLLADEVEHTRFIGFENGKFGHITDRNWSTVAICVARQPAEKMVSIGENGEVLTYVGGKITEEKIKPAQSCCGTWASSMACRSLAA